MYLCLLFSSRSAAVATLCLVSLDATTRWTTVSTSGTCLASINFTMPSLHCQKMNKGSDYTTIQSKIIFSKFSPIFEFVNLPVLVARHSTELLQSPSWQHKHSYQGEAGEGTGYLWSLTHLKNFPERTRVLVVLEIHLAQTYRSERYIVISPGNHTILISHVPKKTLPQSKDSPIWHQ